MVTRFSLTLLFLLFAAAIGAQPLVLERSRGYALKTHVSHLRDTLGQMTLADVQHARFERNPSINYGFDNGVHWFFFEVENQTDEREWLLEIAFSPLDSIELYYKADDEWVRKVSGDNYKISVREVVHPNPVFVLPIDPDETKQCFIRIHTTSSVQLPATLWQEDVFYQRNYSQQLINGLFYGALLVMVIYQLFLFVSTGDRISLYYVFTLLAMMHVVAYFQGFSFLYLYPDRPELNHYMAVFTGPFFLFFSTWLTRKFLNLSETNVWLDRLLLLNLFVDVVGALLILFFFDVFSYRIHHYAILCHCVLAMIAAADSIYRKFSPALFYLLSWLTLLFCAFIFSLSNLGVFRKYLVTDATWLIIGSALQMLFISFAIGSRWLRITGENQRVKEVAFLRAQRERERLEHEVNVRTREIETKSQKLEEVNRIKDKLFSVVSHDIKGPLTSLQLALNLVRNDTITEKEFRDLVGILDTRFTQTTEFIENMLQWASLQLKGITYDPGFIDIHKLGQDTLSLLEYEIQNKNIIARNLIPPSTIAYADTNMIRSIIRNLVMNAVKFTAKGGTVTIDARNEGSAVVISVSDTGIGIPEANRAKLFSLDGVTTTGTKQEKGTGLGLLLCKEFVDRNKGTIWFDTEEGKGTTFHFSLPVNEVTVHESA